MTRHHLDGKATAKDVKEILQQTTDGVENVKFVNDNVKAVDDKVQTMADGGKSIYQVVAVISEFRHLDGKATAKDVKAILQQTTDGVENVKLVNDNVRVVDDKVQMIANGG